MKRAKVAADVAVLEREPVSDLQRLLKAPMVLSEQTKAPPPMTLQIHANVDGIRRGSLQGILVVDKVTHKVLLASHVRCSGAMEMRTANRHADRAVLGANVYIETSAVVEVDIWGDGAWQKVSDVDRRAWMTENRFNELYQRRC